MNLGMFERRYTPRKIAWIEAQIRFIQFLNRVLYIGLAIAFGAFVASFAVPQKKAFQALELKLAEKQETEKELMAQKTNKSIELKALREDISYLELMARDRLNYYREGERVLRFQDFR